MIVPLTHVIRRRITHGLRLRWVRSTASLIALFFAFPALTLAQIGGSPFESGLSGPESRHFFELTMGHNLFPFRRILIIRSYFRAPVGVVRRPVLESANASFPSVRAPMHAKSIEE